MTIDFLAKLGTLQKLATEIDSSKDGNKSGNLDTEKEISVFTEKIKSYNFSEAEMKNFNAIFGLETSDATAPAKIEQKNNVTSNPIKSEKLTKSDKKRMESYVLTLLNQNIAEAPADLVTKIQKTLGDSANNEYYKDLVGQISYILDAVNKQGYQSREDVEKLYDSVKKDLGISRRDNFAKDVLKALVLNAESAQKTKEYSEIETAYNKYIGEGKSMDEAFKAVKDEFKDKGSYYNRYYQKSDSYWRQDPGWQEGLLSKFEQQRVMGDARLTVYKASDEAKGTKYREVKKETKENLKADGDYNKYTKKALKGELSFGEKISFETSDMKNVLKAQAIENNVETKLVQSKEDILKVLGEDSPLFEALVAKELITIQPDGNYNLSRLSAIIDDYIGAENFASRQLSDFKSIAEQTKITSSLAQKMDLDNLTTDEAKKLIKLCGYKIEKKNWGKAIVGTILGGISSGIGGAAAVATNPRATVDSQIIHNSHLEVNINCSSEIAEQIKTDYVGQEGVTVNIISTGVQIVIDKQDIIPLFYQASRHIVKTAMKSAMVGAAIGLLTSLNKEDGELPITATKIECTTLDEYKKILQNEVKQGAISQKYADALITIAGTFEKDGEWDCKGYEEFLAVDAAGRGSVLNRAELIVALKDMLIELDKEMDKTGEPDEMPVKAKQDKRPAESSPVRDCVDNDCNASIIQDINMKDSNKYYWDEIINMYYSDCLKENGGTHTMKEIRFKIREVNNIPHDYKSIPANIILPYDLFGDGSCERTERKEVALRPRGEMAKVKVLTMQLGDCTAIDECDGQTATGKTKEEALANLKQKTGKTYTNEEELLK